MKKKLNSFLKALLKPTPKRGKNILIFLGRACQRQANYPDPIRRTQWITSTAWAHRSIHKIPSKNAPRSNLKVGLKPFCDQNALTLFWKLAWNEECKLFRYLQVKAEFFLIKI